MIRWRRFWKTEEERQALRDALKAAAENPHPGSPADEWEEKEIPPCNLKLTPEEEAEGWELKYQGGMWVKTFDLRKVKEITIKLSKE